GERGGDQLAVADDEDVAAGALAQVAGEVAEDRLAAAPALGVGEGPGVVAVGGALHPGQDTALVAGPGDDGDVGGRRERLLLTDDHDGGAALTAAVGAERAGAAGVGDADAAERPAGSGGQAGPHAFGDRFDVGFGEVHALGRDAQPVQVAGEGERLAVDALDRFEDAVADHQTVVVDGDRCLLGVYQSPVDPDRYVHLFPPVDARVMRRAAFNSVSRHSREGSDPQVIPAPVPKRMRRWWIQNVRIPTASAAVRLSASIHPTAPQYGPRGSGSSASMMRTADDLGAPVTEPGGKVAANSSGQPAPRASRARTVETRWTRPGCSSTAHSFGALTVPTAATRPRSFRTRSTIITF